LFAVAIPALKGRAKFSRRSATNETLEPSADRSDTFAAKAMIAGVALVIGIGVRIWE
jgi:hypothetical protein